MEMLPNYLELSRLYYSILPQTDRWQSTYEFASSPIDDIVNVCGNKAGTYRRVFIAPYYRVTF